MYNHLLVLGHKATYGNESSIAKTQMSVLEEWFVSIAGTDPVIQALLGGFVIAFLNLVGAVLILVWRDPSQRSMDGALGFGAGVMLAASFTSLILPGIEFAAKPTYSAFTLFGVPLDGINTVVIGLVLGILVLDRADAWVPHIHVLITGHVRDDQGRRPSAAPTDGGGDQTRVASVLLFIVAITLHNMPEGLAVGVGFGSGTRQLGNAIALMLAIGIQNIPEGFAVSVAAVNAGFSKGLYAAFTGIRAGLVEIPLTVFGAWAVTVAGPILPYAMGFAAGGMLFVISDEIIPETHSNGNERIATLGTMAGFLVMLYLDVALG